MISLPGAHAVVVRLETHLDGRARLRHRHRVHRQRVRQVEDAEAAGQGARPLAVLTVTVVAVTLAGGALVRRRAEECRGRQEERVERGHD